MSRLTKRQKETLEVLREHPALTCEELGELLGTSPEGAAKTASSLHRQHRDFDGLRVRRTREGGRVRYEAVAS